MLYILSPGNNMRKAVKYLELSFLRKRYLTAFVIYLLMHDDDPQGSKHVAFYKGKYFYNTGRVLLKTLFVI
jgi:hypothetical protein